ncbi:MAG TPA: sugar phosphate nucleotidyltransferase [Ignavibacteria bacterium]
MILAAGFGSRLKPLTDNTPKAMIVYKGKTLIKHQIERLKKAGVSEIVINAHHLADKLSDYIRVNDFGVKINVIEEKEILGTGGGVLNASFFLKNEKSFVVINVDVDTDFNLLDMFEYHQVHNSFVTLAIQKRKTKRYLEFDSELFLTRRANEHSQEKNLFAFNGIHIISGDIFNEGFEIKYLDIIDLFLELIQRGRKIKGFDMGLSGFKDIGKLQNLQ